MRGKPVEATTFAAVILTFVLGVLVGAKSSLHAVWQPP